MAVRDSGAGAHEGAGRVLVDWRGLILYGTLVERSRDTVVVETVGPAPFRGARVSLREVGGWVVSSGREWLVLAVEAGTGGADTSFVLTLGRIG